MIFLILNKKQDVKLFNELISKFERSDWSRNPELGLIDTILDQRPDLLKYLSKDILRGSKANDFGRKDTPTVEQIMRAAIFKEFKSLTYRDLEYVQAVV